jgi:photosynthetic reaction center H subunit
MTGAITGYIDVAQLTLYAFWIFFAGLIYYLHREDKREGYQLVSERSEYIKVEGFPAMPPPKTFHLHHGGTITVPRIDQPETIRGKLAEPFAGAPLVPTGNPLVDGVGPAAYAQRADEPELAWDDNLPKLVPLRFDRAYFVATEDPDPVGMKVIGCDNQVAGSIVDVWVDRSEAMIRYLEAAVGARRVMIPMTMLRINETAREVVVQSITAAQFADVPGLKHPDQITLLEEDKIMGYFGGGTLYATAARSEPLL